MKGQQIDPVRFLVLALLVFAALLIFHSPAISDPGRNAPAPIDGIEQGVRDLRDARRSLGYVLTFMKARSDVFSDPGGKERPMPSQDQKMAVWQIWQGFLDAMLSVDLVGQKQTALAKRGISLPEEEAFFFSYAIFLTQYRHALDFMRLAEGMPNSQVLLNEPLPELGIEGGAYAELKSRFLSAAVASKFASMDMRYQGRSLTPSGMLAQMIEEDRSVVWEAAKGSGPLLTLKNAVQIAKDSGHEAWFPFQTQLARWLGHTKVWRQGQSLITQAQIRAAWPLLRPGDVLLTRREWFLSNVGLPGFWPHALLYVGTPSERRRFFESDMGVDVYVKMHGVSSGDFETLLQHRFPAAYRESTTEDGEYRLPRIIEATSDGVRFAALEEAAAADSLAVLRPLLPKVAMARSVLRAFQYSGRPYDFDFDFLTDSRLVCTELVTKCYEPEPHIAGLHLPLRDILGKKVITANDMVQRFDAEYGNAMAQFEFVLFLDGNETDEVAYRSGAEAFRQSWKRPKWHILVAESQKGAR